MLALSFFIIVSFIYTTVDCAEVKPSDLAYVCPDFLMSQKLSWQRPDVTLTLFGFIRETPFYDSRQVLGFRENLRLVLPTFRLYDSSCADINDRSSLSIVALDTRMRLLFNKSKIGSVDVLGYLEMDYQGPWLMDNSNNIQLGVQSGTNGAVMRHALARVATKHCSLLAGLYWHPLVVPESGPYDYVPFERTPFEPVARAPQIRLTAHNSWIEGIFALVSQFDYRSNGPGGFSPQYLRNAVLPNLNAQLRFYTGNHVFGAAADYKRIIPQLSTTNSSGQLFAATNGVDSFSAMGYCQLQWRSFVARLKAIYASNLIDQYMLPGYGIHTVDIISNVPRFTPISHFVTTAEFFLKKELSPGLFIGISKNLGASERLLVNNNQTGNARVSIFGFGGGTGNGAGGLSPNYNAVDYVFEVAPRLIWNVKPLVVMGEFQYWRCLYGTLNSHGKVYDTSPVKNIRCVASLYYYF